MVSSRTPNEILSALQSCFLFFLASRSQSLDKKRMALTEQFLSDTTLASP